MSAARHIPITAAVTHDVTIDATYTPSPKYVVAGYGDTIWFRNNSSIQLVVQCGVNPPGGSVQVGGNLTVPTTPIGASFVAPNSDGATNYYIYQSGNPTPLSGPWAIQVGNGPIYVTVNGGLTAPDPVAVPPGGNPGGKLEIYATDNNNYTIAWPGGDPFTPAVGSVVPGMQNNSVQTVNNTGAVKDYNYTVRQSGSFTEGNGGGKVKVGS